MKVFVFRGFYVRITGVGTLCFRPLCARTVRTGSCLTKTIRAHAGRLRQAGLPKPEQGPSCVLGLPLWHAKDETCNGRCHESNDNRSYHIIEVIEIIDADIGRKSCQAPGHGVGLNLHQACKQASQAAADYDGQERTAVFYESAEHGRFRAAQDCREAYGAEQFLLSWVLGPEEVSEHGSTHRDIRDGAGCQEQGVIPHFRQECHDNRHDEVSRTHHDQEGLDGRVKSHHAPVAQCIGQEGAHKADSFANPGSDGTKEHQGNRQGYHQCKYRNQEILQKVRYDFL